jgi:hypothetical protein
MPRIPINLADLGCEVDEGWVRRTNTQLNSNPPADGRCEAGFTKLKKDEDAPPRTGGDSQLGNR